MENKEMNNTYKNEQNQMNEDTNVFENVQNTDVVSDVQNSNPTEDTQPVNFQQPGNTSQPVQQQPVFYTAGQPYNSYQQSPYNVMNSNSYSNYTMPADSKKKTKNKGTGKKVALVAGALALALCVGVGGGFLGSYLASQNNDTVQTNTTESSKSSSDSNKSSAALNITKAENTDTAPTNTQEVAAKVKDSVVEITTETTEYDSFYGQYVAQAAGSGVIISQDGYILTNNHVIDGASTITVRLTNSKTYTAKLIGKDATLDVALLKIEEKGLTTAAFGDSSKLNVGQTAIAIGNPLGQLGGTVTDGIISALDREIQIDGKTMNLLQTNAAINPGNSGGGLFDANGNLIGLVVAKSSSTSSGTSVEGLGFAIPANDIVDILEDLKTKGYVTGRGNLGINIVTINTENAMFMYRVDKEGVYVSAVTSGSAAEKAGIKVGDRIVSFNGKDITEGSELTSAVSKLKAGKEVEIKVERDGKEQTLKATLDEKAADNTETNKNNSQSNVFPGRNYFFDDEDGYFGIG